MPCNLPFKYVVSILLGLVVPLIVLLVFVMVGATTVVEFAHIVVAGLACIILTEPRLVLQEISVYLLIILDSVGVSVWLRVKHIYK